MEKPLQHCHRAFLPGPGAGLIEDKMKPILLILTTAVLPHCGKKGKGWERAVDLGTYSISAPVCTSTGASPNYPDLDHKLALYDFDNLSAHTIEVNRFHVVEVFTTADCRLEIQRDIFRNYSGVFSTRANRQHTWSPETCKLPVTIFNTTVAVGSTSSEIFRDNKDGRAEELPFQASWTKGAYTLTTTNQSGLDRLWQAYGCSQPDSITLTFKPESSS